MGEFQNLLPVSCYLFLEAVSLDIFYLNLLMGNWDDKSEGFGKSHF